MEKKIHNTTKHTNKQKEKALKNVQSNTVKKKKKKVNICKSRHVWEGEPRSKRRSRELKQDPRLGSDLTLEEGTRRLRNTRTNDM